jgi:hypothetical protein
MKQIFTFGVGHDHPNKYVEIEGFDAEQCRDIMMTFYGSIWAFQYNSEEEAGVQKFELKRLVKIVVPIQSETLDGSTLVRIS